MSDNELLALAGKTAGWKGHRSKHGYWHLEDPQGKQSEECIGWPSFDPFTGQKLPESTFADALAEAGWHPLTDDGDALRLKRVVLLWCKKNVQIAHSNPTIYAHVSHMQWTFTDPEIGMDVFRIRLVECAAEIGKLLP